MARIPSLRNAEQQVAALERRVTDLTQQLSSITTSCRDIFDLMEEIERQCRRLPSVEYFEECAAAAQEMVRAMDVGR